MFIPTRIVYLCSRCMAVYDRPAMCHGRACYAWDAGLPGDVRSRPCLTAEGRPLCSAPRWWLEAYRTLRQIDANPLLAS